MTLRATESDLQSELLSLYRRTGEATGYWPNYFLRDVRKLGALTVAKKLLTPGTASSGFERLIETRRADLSIEAVALLERFKHLFSAEELSVASERLQSLPPYAFPSTDHTNSLFATEVLDGEYFEGTVTHVLMNRYERDPKARAACIRHHEARCAVCELDFTMKYGKIGEGFIHVHHKKPLSRVGPNYRLNPIRDLIPVCPNCHAMLHRREPPYDVEQLRAIILSSKAEPL